MGMRLVEKVRAEPIWRDSEFRALQITPSAPPRAGGVEVIVGLTARLLPTRGVQCDVASIANGETTVGVTDTLKATRLFPPSHLGTRFHYSTALESFLEEEGMRYNVLHFHNYHSLTTASVRKARGPISCVLSPYFHGPSATLAANLLQVPYRSMIRRLLHRFHAILTISDAERARWCEAFPASEDRVMRIDCPVEIDDIREATPFPKLNPIVVCVGRLERYKNVEQLIHTAAYLPENIGFRIVGDGPERPRLEAACLRKGLDQQVSFVGSIARDELCRWYQTADVLVSLSSSESFGMTIVEGLAAGCHVVAREIATARELKDQYQEAVRLVPADVSPESLADAILSAVKSHRVSADLSRFSPGTYADRLASIYRDLTGARK